MGTGIRATVTFDNPNVCPIADLAAETGATVDSVPRSVSPPEGPGTVTEFSLPEEISTPENVEHVISYESRHVYRLRHRAGDHCPCVSLGEHGCPVQRYFAAEGTLTVVFHSGGYERLQEVVAVLRERYPTIDIKRFVRSPTADPDADSVFVDRSQLTDRQRRVLQTAYEMGYFERPRRANASEVAAELDITPSTLREHLVAAQEKLLGDVLAEE